MRRRSLIVGLLLALSGASTLALAAAQRPGNAIQVPDPMFLAFTPAPTFPPGVQMAVLEGDPRSSGPFTVRLRYAPGIRLQPHTHATDERATVISGRMQVNFGNMFDMAGATSFGPGGFYVNPAGVPHFEWADQDTIVQVSGFGPFTLSNVPVVATPAPPVPTAPGSNPAVPAPPPPPPPGAAVRIHR